MGRTIAAFFEDGVFKPLLPLELPPNSLVRIMVESWEEVTEASDRDWQEPERCWDEIEFDSGRARPARDELQDIV